MEAEQAVWYVIGVPKRNLPFLCSGTTFTTPEKALERARLLAEVDEDCHYIVARGAYRVQKMDNPILVQEI